MDTAEFAAALEEAHRHQALATIRAAPQGPPATGTCLFCETHQPQPRRWCDPACRDAWQTQQQRN